MDWSHARFRLPSAGWIRGRAAGAVRGVHANFKPIVCRLYGPRRPKIPSRPMRSAVRDCSRLWRKQPVKVNGGNENRGRPVGARQIALNHLNIERQFIAIDLRRFEDDNNITYRCAVFTQDRHGRIRWVLAKAVALRPFVQHGRSKRVPRRSHRPVGENDTNSAKHPSA